jgi:hypothetical protein
LHEPFQKTLFAMLALAWLALPSAAQDDDPLAALVEAWLSSPHGDYHSPSFTYWNEEGEVPVACAACHSQTGFIDFLGADGSTPGEVNHPGTINSPIGCASCHTTAAHELDSVTFPSGVQVSSLGDSATCSVCHAGRQSGDAVTAATGAIGEDEVSARLAFINIHYGVAASVMHGSEVRGGYHYPGAPMRDASPMCRAPTPARTATTRIPPGGDRFLHGVPSRRRRRVRDIRTRHGDFDGDGNTSGGIHAEIVGLHAQLYEAIQDLCGGRRGNADRLCNRFPYFFVDADGDGEIAPEDAVMPNRYQSWTPRLLKAAYNYQVAAKDAGGYVHNPAYILQLLHDSLESLSAEIDIDMSAMQRP